MNFIHAWTWSARISRRRGRSSLQVVLFALVVLVFGTTARAADVPKVKVGMLEFGSLHWLLDVVQHHGLDKAEGFDLELVPLASTEATRVGLESNSLDIIATDWLWVSRERSAGAHFTFSPFSTELGAVMVPAVSSIEALGELKGKKMGVAGGPLDKSWLMLVAYGLDMGEIDLRTAITPIFGAPPLLAEKLEEGEIDAVLEYWPYAARLEAKGFRQLISIEDVVLELGAKGRVAMVGYVFRDTWANSNKNLIDGFLSAVKKANKILATSDDEWRRIRPLTRVENDATFDALKTHYRAGIPARSVKEDEADAKVLYQFLRTFGGGKLVGPAVILAPGTFWKDSPE
jgi:NitT/TauT family transport system substrate-binding protein